LAVILIAARKQKIVGSYHHPLWMQMAGWLVVIAMSWMGVITIKQSLQKLLQLA